MTTTRYLIIDKKDDVYLKIEADEDIRRELGQFFTFEVPGVYLYQCTPHKGLGMIALVVVGGDTSNKDAVAGAKTLGKSKKILPDLINQL